MGDYPRSEVDRAMKMKEVIMRATSGVWMDPVKGLFKQYLDAGKVPAGGSPWYDLYRPIFGTHCGRRGLQAVSRILSIAVTASLASAP